MELFDPQNLVILAFLHIQRLVSPQAALDVRLLTAESRSAISAFGRYASALLTLDMTLHGIGIAVQHVNPNTSI
ncbi:hypothetical protein SLEP1_g1006 [Rubroshorea leprosula]|uniref:Uncharacterized protein n=1 Tax=Rubroshorea leprosula TaxID=152421 RepID=A0AAV5HLE8_9ROSI|nr:hypothetical protein SLEP1_g1006 [Rubroshorea leprosula]